MVMYNITHNIININIYSIDILNHKVQYIALVLYTQVNSHYMSDMPLLK